VLSTSSSGSFTEREVVHVGRGVFGLGRVSVAIILILKLKIKAGGPVGLGVPCVQ